jgi:hypothetical protein
MRSPKRIRGWADPWTRRRFLLSSAWLGAGCAAIPSAREASADILIVGGGVGGCAAALAACRAGRRVILTEETAWIGGQLTSQAVPPDEHPWIEDFGCTASYRDFRIRIRQFYRERHPLTAAARANPRLNPGNGWVSRLCHEPRVALAVLEAMLAPHVVAGRLQIWLRHRPVSAEADGDFVRAVTLESTEDGTRRTVSAPWILDATELGDLLELARIEHVVGAEARGDTGEPGALPSADPLDQQAITVCFALEYRPGEDHVISRPHDYARWRDFVPRLTPPWTGPLFSWTGCHPVTLEPRTLPFDPSGPAGFPNLWGYRRLLDTSLLEPGAGRFPVSLINWPQNDHWLAPLVGPGVTTRQRAERIAEARRLSLAFAYWLQTDAPRADGGTGWKSLRLAPEITGTDDGLAMAPYIRESRRLRAEFTVCEQHVGTEARRQATGGPTETLRAATFDDSVGIGAYRIDLHPSTSGRNYVDLSTLPFQIPLGALLPRRVENLLAAGKNIGTTHLTNGCYRLHPVEWNIGEAAGALAAFCLGRGVMARQVRRDAGLRGEFQARLRGDGFELEWPASVRPL